ncbi:TPA: KilA-N domain-containing protein [Stenotrophomonas maltophilia]|nr:KilA-N domain-containing protein [Stenotrophomonas maltophilia]
MAELSRQLNHRDSGDLIRATRGRGGGTWFHPKLAVHFARWLSTEFAVWCDLQIDELLRTGQRRAMTVWQQLQAAQVAEKDSAAKGSYGSRLMNDRKREKAGLRRELARLEAQVVIPLFPGEAAA